MRSRYRLAAYLTGATVARTGDELSGPALLLLSMGVDGSAATGSALLAGLTISAAAGGPLLGALLDRSPRPGRLLAWALLAYAGGLGAVLALVGLPAAIVVAVAAGLLNPALAGGWTAQLPHVRGAIPLERASTLDAMTFTAASLAGPGLAGLVAAYAGAPAAVALAITLVAAAFPAAWSLPATDAKPTRPIRRQLADGFAVLFRNRALLRATATSTVSFVGIGIAVVCYPLLGAQRLGNPGFGALLLTVLAAASLVANAVLARRPPPPDRTVLASTVLLGASFLLAAAGHDVVPLLAAAVLAGFAEGPQLSALFAIRHREAPTAVRAQVFTTAASVKITGLAAGAAVAGPLSALSVTAALGAAAGCQLLAAATYVLVRTPGRARTPSPARAA
ncbi:MFS transporter [Amycolatopsis sp. EV170708-02-1]|uniref:MFS transporter n=1 Tax=Amycolatopsis sp. EV170708-02-1 TaxID=2919322 RepID=UPI001F0BAA8C|nr:MFS transporter [Amycolatopsis sp. EV170708-02-1]UMP04279.1 MFS transporter [Amycolatopsis sp. EV170708-02-1]